MEKNYYTNFSCYGYMDTENDYLEYVSDTEYTEILRELEEEEYNARRKELVTN